MGLKDSNEITIKATCQLDELLKSLEDKGFERIKTVTLDDFFMVPNDLDIDKMTTRDILSKAVLVRGLYAPDGKELDHLLTFKRKQFDENGDILSQDSINCGIKSVEDACSLMKAINYKELMRIIENEYIYQNDELQLEVKDIVDGDLLMELETGENPKYNTIEKLKQAVIDYEIPIEPDKYFIKKAEDRLNQILNRN